MQIQNEAFYSLTSGLYVVCVGGEKPCGCVINTALQVTSKPFQMSVTLNKNNHTTGLLLAQDLFSVSVLGENVSMDTIGKFGFRSGASVDKFADFSDYETAEGVPVLSKDVCAAFVLRRVGVTDVGTHVTVVGEVVWARSYGGKPLTYADYHVKKKGTTPPSASAYVPPAQTEGKTVYRCPVCGYETNEKPPEGFVCPLCGQPGSIFERIG